MYADTTERVAQGEGYYDALRAELNRRGYPTKSILNWRLPTLTWINASLPSVRWSQTVMAGLAACAILAWTLLVGRTAPGAATACALVLILSGLAPFISSTAYLHEVWAGFLIMASLGCWGLSYRGWSVGLGLAAALVRELAVPFLVVMAALAWWELRRGEAMAWLTAVLAFAAFWGWHAFQVTSRMPPDGLSASWLAFSGWGFVMSATTANPLLMLLPQWPVALVVPLAWAGLWCWRGALGMRLATLVTLYFALFLFVGRPDNWYWGFLIAPLLSLGPFGYLGQPENTT